VCWIVGGFVGIAFTNADEPNVPASPTTMNLYSGASTGTLEKFPVRKLGIVAVTVADVDCFGKTVIGFEENLPSEPL
jgi:hypothetical protein